MRKFDGVYGVTSSSSSAVTIIIFCCYHHHLLLLDHDTSSSSSSVMLMTSGGLARLPACRMASGPLKHKLIWAPRICVCERESKGRIFFLEKFLRLF
ncbi:hypothetical protein AVEN_11339-1 [Araneus ventricosus]|uniref:Uncharacterized protein n=1 Tax=Araneus ventricosus TaxID=182803 RepID=A0A4Y2U4S3_ARAVE|nr:hypothetical protein AVEN_11339-1 [Araneus ventricosus]